MRLCLKHGQMQRNWLKRACAIVLVVYTLPNGSLYFLPLAPPFVLLFILVPLETVYYKAGEFTNDCIESALLGLI